jgi:hypothetical protein
MNCVIFLDYYLNFEVHYISSQSHPPSIHRFKMCVVFRIRIYLGLSYFLKNCRRLVSYLNEEFGFLLLDFNRLFILFNLRSLCFIQSGLNLSSIPIFYSLPFRILEFIMLISASLSFHLNFYFYHHYLNFFNVIVLGLY